MDLSALKIESYDVKDKIVLIYDVDFENERVLEAIGKAMRKAGAVDVIFTDGIKLETLSDDELLKLGLHRTMSGKPRSKKKHGEEPLH